MGDEKTPLAEGKEQLRTEAVPAPTDKAEKTKPKVEAPKVGQTYTEEEYQAAVETERKRYSGLDSKFTKQRAKWEQQVKDLETARDEAAAQAEEARYKSFIQSVEDDGGDVSAAQRLIDRERKIVQQERQQNTLKTWITQQQTLLNEAAKGKQAEDLMKQYELPAEQLEKLLDAKDPTAMENVALKFRLERIKVGQRPPAKIDPGRGKRGSGDLSKLPPSVALGQLMEEES